MLSRVLAGVAALLCLGGTVLPWISLPGLGEFGYRDLGAWQRTLAAVAAGLAAIFYLLGWRRLGLTFFGLFGVNLIVGLGRAVMMLQEMAALFPEGGKSGAEPPWRKMAEASELRPGAVLLLLGVAIWLLSLLLPKSNFQRNSSREIG